MQPKLKIGSVDFTDLVQSIKPSKNDLDADGSGRDVHTGEMYRTKITDKDKIDVTMMRLWETDAVALETALDHAFVSVQYLKPGTNTHVTQTMYCSAINYGIQAYNRSRQKTYYEGVTFQLTEK